MQKIIYLCIVAVFFTKVQAQELIGKANEIAADRIGKSSLITYIDNIAFAHVQEVIKNHNISADSKLLYAQNKPLPYYQDTINPVSGITPFASAGGAGYDYGYNIAVDGIGNVYITGFYNGTAIFDSISITSRGNEDIFVAKYNKNGILLWVKSAGGTGFDIGKDIAVDSIGNVYVTGFYSGRTTFGKNVINSNGSLNIFIIKYSSDGTIQWVKPAGHANDAIGPSIALDNKGNVFLSGTYKSKGATVAGLSPKTLFTPPDIFVAKYTSRGDFQWVKLVAVKGLAEVYKIAVDLSGKVYITGCYTGVASFGSISIASQGGYDVFLAKYDPIEENWSWTQSAGGKGDDFGRRICLDKSGNVYMTGTNTQTATFGASKLTSEGQHDIFVVKYNTNGLLQWIRSAGEPDNDLAYGIAVDNIGNVYVAGEFRDKIAFDSIIKTSGGSADIFVARYDSSGTLQWVDSFGGVAHETAQSIAVDYKGNIYITGGYSGTISFGKTSLVSKGDRDISIIKINSAPNP